uniref:endonuclease/exonuclease/phosphatase family protein n=1 Tax=Ornithobacterium rhinotracheale TaxID=28251 RepID=UPI0039A5DE78
MRIISWNCNGAFRKKFEFLSKFSPDIMVIQECENPAITKDLAYKEFSTNHIWIGKNQNKGLGIFAKESIKIQKLNWSNIYFNHDVNYFLPIIFNDSQILIGIWAHKNNSPTFGYIGQVWKYFQINSDKIFNSIIIGDFNSNKIWDCWDRWWNHTDVLNIFEENNLVSLYHYLYNEKQGEENLKTFFLHKNHLKGYHIDYCFLPKQLITTKTTLNIPDFEIISKLSDHCPLIIDY